jgi:hypothetical protein
MAAMTEEDGSLPEARRRLEDAVSGLVDPQLEVVDGRTHWIDSPFTQLLEAIPGEQGTGHGVARSLPPLWLDAADLKAEIETATAAWLPKPVIDLLQGDAVPLAVIRLQQLETKGWRPQDCKAMDQISGIVEAWTACIKSLLNPTPKWTLPAPCPRCEKSIVYRKESGGDTVRMPALHLNFDAAGDAENCVCLACREVWPRDRLPFLAEVLGTYPENVDAA